MFFVLFCFLKHVDFSKLQNTWMRRSSSRMSPKSQTHSDTISHLRIAVQSTSEHRITVQSASEHQVFSTSRTHDETSNKQTDRTNTNSRSCVASTLNIELIIGGDAPPLTAFDAPPTPGLACPIGIILTSFHSFWHFLASFWWVFNHFDMFLHFLTFWHVQNSRNVFFQTKQKHDARGLNKSV